MAGLYRRAAVTSALGAALAACGGTPPPSTVPSPAHPAAGVPRSPAAAPVVSHTLPPIPHVSGPLAIAVVYPHPGAVIETRDSNFVLGSVGTGDATLTINGYPVAVRANGAFLAWLPVPDSAMSRYDLVAVAGKDTARLSYPVRLLPSRRSMQDSLLDETLTEQRKPFPDSGHFVTIAARDTTLPDTDRSVIARPVPAGTYKWFLLPGTVLEVTGRSGDFERVRLDAALDVWIATADIRPYNPLAPSPTAGGPAGGPIGSRAVVTPPSARRASTPPPPMVSALVSPSPLQVEQPPRRVVGVVRVVPAHDWVDVVFTMSERPPYYIEENGSDLEVTFYSTQASTDLIQYVGRLGEAPGPPDTLVRSVTWQQVMSDRAAYTVHLSQPSFGYLVLWTSSGFVLRVRRPPVIDAASPLRDLTIAVDAGHPPAGSTGPTGLYEPVATLAVAQQLATMLIARGAAVVMTRTTADPVGLTSRPVMARRANVDAMVSIHLNALPDGMNPYTSHGTGSYYFQPHSIALARDVQTGMVASMGLRDLGVHYDNLAVVRPTWMPAVLCEGAFVIIPEQEAALRTPAFQTQYAQGVADGLTAYFRSLAPAAPASVPPPTSAPATVPPPVPATVSGASGSPH
jgi:N-acetylmuramoyl-L-alanine amidase